MSAVPGSATKIITAVFGNPVFGDLDGNGKTDAAILLVQDPGGSGTFYYVAAALGTDGEYSGTEAVFIGDRIKPEDMDIRNGTVLVKYKDRKPNDAMSVSPSILKSHMLTVKNGKLAETNTSFKSGLIYLESPAPGDTVASPLKISGFARGTWFFEGDFPVVFEDEKGNTLARGFCTATTDWMTTDYVRFKGTITFENPGDSSKGMLILKKDNPTGLPRHDDALKILVYFK